METFEYVGRNTRGESMRGSIEAGSAQAAAVWLTNAGIFPVSIRAQQQQLRKQSDTPPWLARITGENKVKPADLLMFTRQMANMVRAGMQVIEAIDGFQKSTTSIPLARVLLAVRDDLDRGANLSSAFSRHPHVFDDYYVNMVKVGEGTGKLQESFRALYSQIEFDRSIKQRMKAATRYPTFVVVALTFAISILAIFVIPQFAKTYSAMKAELPLLTRMLLGFSNFAVAYWWLVALAAVATYMGMKAAMRTPDVRYAWDKWKLKVPVMGPIMMKATVARFARSFATALKADVPIVMAFTLVSRVVDNAFFEDRILQMQKSVQKGEVLSRVMRTAEIFSPLELQLIAVGERTAEVEKAVDDIAEIYTEELEFQVSRISQTVEPLLLAALGIVVALLVLGVFLPLWDMSQAQLHRK